MTWFIARQIVQPLQMAVGIASDVAKGNLSLREVQAGADETGQVLRALGEVTQRLNAMIANIRAGIEHIRGAAPQLTGVQRWHELARYIANKILAFVPNTPIPAVVATG